MLDMGGGNKVPATRVEIKERHEKESEYVLEDGSTIRVIHPVMAIYRFDGPKAYDTRGNPVYFVMAQPLPFTIKSEALMQKPMDGEKPV